MTAAPQASLFDAPFGTRIPDPPRVQPRLKRKRGPNLRDETERWMADNHATYQAVERFALEARDAGRRFGIKLLLERVRWEVVIHHKSDLKINNSFAPYIARALINKHPELAALIICRKTKW